MNIGMGVRFSYDQYKTNQILQRENMHITCSTWSKTLATPIPKKGSQTRRMFGAHMTFTRNQPAQIRNQQLQQVRATYI